MEKQQMDSFMLNMGDLGFAMKTNYFQNFFFVICSVLDTIKVRFKTFLK